MATTADKHKPRKLTDTQTRVLKSIITPGPGSPAGEWYDGCGWIWGTHSEMQRILAALEKRGLVERSEETFGDRGWTHTVFRVTEAGFAAVADPAA